MTDTTTTHTDTPQDAEIVDERALERADLRAGRLAALATLADFADLPIFNGLALPPVRTVEDGLAVLAGSAYRTTRSATTDTVAGRALVRDDDGNPEALEVVASFEGASGLDQRAFARYLQGFSTLPRAPIKGVANAVCHALVAVLSPDKLTVTVKGNAGKSVAKYKSEAEPDAHPLAVDALRLVLALRVPTAIRSIIARGTPPEGEVERSAESADKLLRDLRGAALSAFANPARVDHVVECVALASFGDSGIWIAGLHFDANDFKGEGE